MSDTRISLPAAAPHLYKALLHTNQALEDSTLSKALIDLVYLRISQLNGCAYCVDKHARDALLQGEDFQRINSLVTWREVEFFSARERAAFAWAEALTLVSETHAPDALYNDLKPHFSDKEIAELSFAIALMNTWNRIGVGLRLPVKHAAFVS